MALRTARVAWRHRCVTPLSVSRRRLTTAMSCCCPANSEPARATDPFANKTITVGADHTTAIYRTGPTTARVGVLAFPNIFGLDSGRSKQDADRLGALGYAVAFVDATGGDYAHDAKEMDAWVARQDFDSVLLPRIREAIAHLKTDAQVETIASYGYCWGGWVGARLSAEPGQLTVGNVSFHPSWGVENMVNGGDGALEKLAQRVRAPQLLLSAGNDLEELKQGGTVQKILRDHGDNVVASLSQVVDFPDAKHGWVNRGDLDDPVVKQYVDKAWTLAYAFLQTVTVL